MKSSEAPPPSSPISLPPPQAQARDENHGTGENDAEADESAIISTSPYRIPSISKSMVEGAALMRELDADILEMGIGDSCSSGETPVLGPLNYPITSSSLLDNNFDLLPPQSSASLLAPVASLSPMNKRRTTNTNNQYSSLPNLPYYSSSTGSRIDNNEIGQKINDIYDSKLDPPTAAASLWNGTSKKVTLRRCLSGEERRVITALEEQDATTSEKQHVKPTEDDSAISISVSSSVINEAGTSPVCVADTDVTVGNDSSEEVGVSAAAATQMSSNQVAAESHIIRSNSKERLLLESIQFAEAVGEIPPTESELQEIIEESGPDDDDDDDDEDNDDNEEEPNLNHIVHMQDASSSSDDIVRIRESSGNSQLLPFVVGDSNEGSNISNNSLSGGSTLLNNSNHRRPERAPVGPAPYGDNSLQKHGGSVVPDMTYASSPTNSRRLVRPRASSHFNRNKQQQQQQQQQQQNFPGDRKVDNRNNQPSFILHKLPDGVENQDYQYKGICANPPEITKRGISRGNYAQLHRKAWLEVSDKYHRYGKNLRAYYKHWETLGHPTNMFFDWLDCKGEAAGWQLPNLESCPRSQLDSDTVLYITNEDKQKQYEIFLEPDKNGHGLVVDIFGDRVCTGPEGWIFVLRDHKLYASEKVTSITGFKSKQRFHHSSFFGGKAVSAAGIIITDNNGYLTRFYPHSGHYRPGEAHMQRMLFHIHHSGVDLRTFEVDTQQILHVGRKDTAPKGGRATNAGGLQSHEATTGVEKEQKKKKVQTLHLKQAVYVACFLAHKARFLGEGVFAQIHMIRKADVTTVTEALNAVDDGGVWKK